MRLRRARRTRARHRGEQRHIVLGVLTEGDAFRRALQSTRHPAAVPAKRRRLHRRQGVRAPRNRQGRCKARDRRRVRHGAEADADYGRVLRCWKLRDVRASVRAEIPLDVAERPETKRRVYLLRQGT